mmetsp:Transcript_92499/g.198317  ORF Transcript_92499/g.198317 Transcript_92499/m.198317 type:complete len:211 (+) Transcript_92499:414-1046(+)
MELCAGGALILSSATPPGIAVLSCGVCSEFRCVVGEVVCKRHSRALGPDLVDLCSAPELGRALHQIACPSLEPAPVDHLRAIPMLASLPGSLLLLVLPPGADCWGASSEGVGHCGRLCCCIHTGPLHAQRPLGPAVFSALVLATIPVWSAGLRVAAGCEIPTDATALQHATRLGKHRVHRRIRPNGAKAGACANMAVAFGGDPPLCIGVA